MGAYMCAESITKMVDQLGDANLWKSRKSGDFFCCANPPPNIKPFLPLKNTQIDQEQPTPQQNRPVSFGFCEHL